MKISACLILFNVEKWIAKTIYSIDKHVQEIICVIDTKTTDKTKEILQTLNGKNKIKIFDRDWNDNFADARNFAISKASGDYILTIDGDEVLFAKAPLKEYIKFSEKRGAGAYKFKIHNKDIRGNKTIFSNIRLFKKGIKYENMRHAVVDGNVRNKEYKIVQIEDIYIEHNGHIISDKQMITKIKKELILHFQQLKAEPHNRVINFHIGEYYQLLYSLTKKKNYLSDAITFLSLAITDGLSTGMEAMIYYKLARLYYETGSIGICTQWIEKSLIKIPEQIYSRDLMFVILVQNGYIKEARKEAIKIRKINGNSKLPYDIHYSQEDLKTFLKLKIK